MESVRHLIVGSGVTGLTFANFTSCPPKDWLVLEAMDRPGGYCKTITQDGFVWDYSGHFFHFRHPDIEAWLRARMPEDQVETITKSSGILFEDTRVDFPFQKNIHQLPEPHFKQCLDDLLATRNHTGTINSFQDMLYARLGKAICEKFLVPYNEKLYACALNELDADAMGRFFPHANIEEILKNFESADNQSYNATFTYPTGGAIEYIKALLHDLPDDRISYEERLVSIDVKAKVATTTKRQIQYQNLISSMPFNRLLDATEMPYDPSIYTWNKVLVFNLGFDKKGWTRDHWVYIPDRETCFYRVGFYDNIFNTDRMSCYIEIGMHRQQDVGDVNTWLDKVLKDLAKHGIVTDHELVSWHSVVLDPAYVHITKASLEDFSARVAVLKAQGIHSVGRYGGWTYCSIEDNIIEARALAQSLD